MKPFVIKPPPVVARERHPYGVRNPVKHTENPIWVKELKHPSFGEFKSVKPLPPPPPYVPDENDLVETPRWMERGFQREKEYDARLAQEKRSKEISRMEQEDEASKEWRRKQRAPPNDLGSFFRQAFGFRQGGKVRPIC
jgi:hypothetical protein